jgi:hypothetical protein
LRRRRVAIIGKPNCRSGPGLAEAGDTIYRDIGKLTGEDRELAKDFLKMLAERSEAKRK